MLQNILFWVSTITLYIMLTIFVNGAFVKKLLDITIKTIAQEKTAEIRYFYLLTYGWVCSVFWSVFTIFIGIVVFIFWSVW